MITKEIERIFTGEFDPEETQNLCFNPAEHHIRVVGLLFSADVSVSLSFGNGTDLQVNQMEFAHKHESSTLSPNNRVLNLDHELKDQIITGTVTNTRTAYVGAKRTINVYLIIEHEHEG